MFWMVAGIPLLPTLPALAWEPTELAEGTGERGDGVPVLLATHGEGARAALEDPWKCSLRVRENFIALSFLQRNMAMFRTDWQRMHKTANIFSCVGAVGSEKDFNDIMNLMRSSVSEYTEYADLDADLDTGLSDSMAIPHSMKDKAASKYLKAFPTLSVCGRAWSLLGRKQPFTSFLTHMPHCHVPPRSALNSGYGDV